MKDIFPSEQELRDVCFESFGEVYRNLRETDRWDHIAREIISFCRSRGITDVLWDLMRQRSPKNVAKYDT